jgi:hypothetical protein
MDEFSSLETMQKKTTELQQLELELLQNHHVEMKM